MKKLIVVAIMLLPLPALAQQALSPSQTALQINAVLGQWAQALEHDQQLIAQLQGEIKSLKDKYEPEKKDAKPK